MTILFEQPIPILITGILGLSAFLAALLKTGLVRFLYLAIVAVAVTLALLFVESTVVTPREEIELTLDRIARDLESNQPPRVLQHISQQSPDVRKAVERALKQVEIHRVSVKRNLEVTFPQGSASTAIASFNAVITGSKRKGVVRNQTAPWFFVVEFSKESGEWRVTGYKRLSPQKGLGR